MNKVFLHALVLTLALPASAAYAQQKMVDMDMAKKPAGAGLVPSLPGAVASSFE